ncbi:BTAD domain-containing putative transcriptional regulator [Micromonospora sp. WMMD980]|uniref:BTAD domain-containing putative transcriptional regulator n=1 Tax=Micromonospora sp. WMMD980 TaxID=3016088 RepID=UPI0024160690|nr:BTAD domain-containing putative transcriptional regulator [Micromonospora sp. WMMD980]MDG4803168.1 BTAD domain-containing putative transcriptional regulator [Micromonospora sp. WMMD980]
MFAFLAATARRLAGLGILVLLTAGVPYALIRYVGWPLPRQVPTWQDVGTALTSPLTDAMLGNAVVCLLWAVWAAFIWSLIAEVAETVTGIRLPQPRAIAPARGLAAILVAAISGGVLATAAQAAPTLTQPAQATTAHTSATATAPATTLPSSTVRLVSTDGHHTQTGQAPASTAALPGMGDPVPARLVAGHVTLVSSGQTYTCEVRRGDTLSKIAQQWLGDANRWPEIFALNRGTHFRDTGGTLTNPNLIYPGWTLELPDDATPPAGTPRTPPPADPPAAGPEQPTPGTAAPAPTPPSQPNPLPPDAPSVSPSPGSTTRAPHDGDDGVVHVPSPPVSTAPAEQPSASGASTTPSPAVDGQQTPGPRTEASPGVSLGTGSWLDAGLVAAILAAVALVWAHRRRRYTRRPVSVDLRLDDPDVAPMPPVVNQIRRLRHATTTPTDPAGHEVPDENLGLFTDPAGTEANDKTDDGTSAPDSPDASDQDAGLLDVDRPGIAGRYDEDDPKTPAPAADPSLGDDAALRPVVPSLAHPLAAVWPPAGLGLTGPGAEAAARGFMAAALAAGGLDAPEDRTWLVMPSATAATLLGAGAVALPRTPRLTVTGGLDEALDLLEAQTLHRSRIAYAHEVDTAAEARAADPTGEPMPPVLLLADADTRHQRTRIAALLAQGQRLDIHGVLLGTWPDGDTVVVAEDGTTSRAHGEGSRHSGHPADIGRLAVLTASETSDLLVTLAESHTGQPQAPAPIEPVTTAQATTAPPDAQPSPDTEPAPADVPVREGNHLPASGPEPVPVAPTATAGSASSETAPATQAAPPTDAHAGGADTARDGAPSPAVEEPDNDGGAENSQEASHGRVQVSVLGTAAIVDVPPGPTLRKKSLEVLVYLAVHYGDASAEAILDDLLPDAPANKAPGRLYTYVSDLRTIMRRTAGRGSYLTHPHQRYVLNRDAVDVDLWRMRAAIRDANQATDPAERLAALRRAVDAYRGHLADGADYEWIEPYREAVRQQALDAYLALVDALTGDPAEQLTVLDAAIGHNPYAEELYQQAMRARAALGHLDAIRSLRRSLTRALGEIDAEPSDETIALADELVAQVQRPARRPDLRPAPRPGDGAAA